MELTRLEKNGLCGIVFDCDGVMIDSEDANRRFYDLVLGALGLPSMTREEEEYAFMATARDALEKVVPRERHGEIEDAILRGVNYEKDVLPHIKLMPGFREFIDFAHDRGFHLAIDTNRTEPGIMCILDFFALPPYFDPVISSSNATPKPSPQGLEKICRAWGAAPAQVLFVGDSVNDRKTAQGAGALFAAFGGKGLAGDLEAPDFAALRQMLQNTPDVSGGNLL